MLITPSLSSQGLGGGCWAREGSSSPDWRGLEGWERGEGIEKGLAGGPSQLSWPDTNSVAWSPHCPSRVVRAGARTADNYPSAAVPGAGSWVGFVGIFFFLSFVYLGPL